MLDRIPDGARSRSSARRFPSWSADGVLYAVHSDSYWIDAGTPEAYLQAHLDLLDGDRGAPEAGVHAGARVDGTAAVVRSSVGAGAVIAAGAEVVESVVMAGARVGPGASRIDCLIGSGARVGEGAELSELSVVGFGEEVPPGPSRRPAGSLRPRNGARHEGDW